MIQSFCKDTTFFYINLFVALVLKTKKPLPKGRGFFVGVNLLPSII